MRAKRRYRVMVWLDEAFDPEQAAVAVYVDDDKVRETTWNVGPFDHPDDIFDVARQSVDIQGRLW